MYSIDIETYQVPEGWYWYMPKWECSDLVIFSNKEEAENIAKTYAGKCIATIAELRQNPKPYKRIDEDYIIKTLPFYSGHFYPDPHYIGYRDDEGRWFMQEKFVVPGYFHGVRPPTRPPTRSRPDSILDDIRSKHYYRDLYLWNFDLWLDAIGVWKRHLPQKEKDWEVILENMPRRNTKKSSEILNSPYISMKDLTR